MDASVVVVGAGPAGLMLAGELRLAGADVTVLERHRARTGEPRGIGLTTGTMEVFDQRGLLRRFEPHDTADTGHFGGVPFDPGVLAPHLRPARTIPQSATEQVLEDWARELGADLRRGHDYLGHRDEGDTVTLTVRRDDGTEYELATRYLVGCDGGRSAVREDAGFDFPGTAATTEMLLADLRGVDLEPRTTGEHAGGGFVTVAELPGGIHRIIVGEHGIPPRRRTGPPAFEEVADLWKRLTGIDVSHAEPVRVSAFGNASRQVSAYRRGRVLLAGDAAHVHLPAGGQGMDTSLQDSHNLGWKLASVLRGDAPEDLLDTYHAERHPVGRALLADTRAQSRPVPGGEEAVPLREVLAELVGLPGATRHLAAEVSDKDIRYEVGGGANPLLGRRLPHLPLTTADGTGTTSTALLRGGRGVLLDLEDNPVLRRRARPWQDRIDVVTADPVLPGPGPADGTAALLVRPDGHVAWAAPGSHHDLPGALARWFGPALGRRP